MDTNGESESLIYLDYNATTPLAEEVVAGISNSLAMDWGNPSSGHLYGRKAKAAVLKARNQIAEMLGCSSSEVIFTSGGTEANNMVIYSILTYFDDKKNNSNICGIRPHVITTNVEHDSVILPLRHLEKKSLLTCSVVKVGKNGCVAVDDVLSNIREETSLISVMYANNETGVIMPISEIGRRLASINAERKNNNLVEVLFHTDAAQMIGKENVNFKESNVDFMTVVGHKFYGPRIGCLCSRGNLFPLFFGGGQEKGMRPGTENTPMIVGLGIAAELVATNLNTYRENMLKCKNKLETGLKEAFGDEIVINCKESSRLPNTTSVSFREDGLEGNLILSRCESVIASVGAACHSGQCSQILINSGIPLELARNSMRLSVGRNTNLQDIEEALSDIKTAVKKLKTHLKT